MNKDLIEMLKKSLESVMYGDTDAEVDEVNKVCLKVSLCAAIEQVLNSQGVDSTVLTMMRGQIVSAIEAMDPQVLGELYLLNGLLFSPNIQDAKVGLQKLYRTDTPEEGLQEAIEKTRRWEQEMNEMLLLECESLNDLPI